MTKNIIMATVGIAVLVAIVGLVGAPAPHHTKFCYTCNGLTDPNQCTREQKCHPDEMCFTDVRHYGGEFHYFKGCRKEKECPMNAWVGKRAAHPDQHLQSQLMCLDCCGDTHCNNIGCDGYGLNTTVAPLVTTPALTPAPTPAPTQPSTAAPGTGGCVDHEEDGHSCSTYDQYNFCAETDPNSLAYTIAHTKCAKHCGFCGISTTPPPPTTTAVPCVDHEEDGFKCTDYDQYNFCTDVSSIAYVFSHQKCPKHCGFCGTNGGGAVASATTGAPVQVTLTSTHPPQPQTNGLVNIVASQAPTTTDKPCVDFEDSTFSCASWKTNGFCQSTTGVLHEITVMRCRKHCNLC